MTETLQNLHNKFCSISGKDYRFCFYEREWFEFNKYFTADDLDTVLRWIMVENARREKQYRIRLALLKIIGDPQVFDSLRADALVWQKAQDAKKRMWQPSAGERALAAMRHEEVKAPETPAKRVDMPFVIQALQQNQ